MADGVHPASTVMLAAAAAWPGIHGHCHVLLAGPQQNPMLLEPPQIHPIQKPPVEDHLVQAGVAARLVRAA